MTCAISTGGCDRCTKHGQEELPHVQGQGQQPRVPGCKGAGTAERSYLASKVRDSGGKELPASEFSGGREELPRVQGQWRPGEATSHPRPGSVTLRSHPEPEARAGSREEQPEERWLRRHRRA